MAHLGCVNRSSVLQPYFGSKKDGLQPLPAKHYTPLNPIYDKKPQGSTGISD
jgi:hypothetical protein